MCRDLEFFPQVLNLVLSYSEIHGAVFVYTFIFGNFTIAHLSRACSDSFGQGKVRNLYLFGETSRQRQYAPLNEADN